MRIDPTKARLSLTATPAVKAMLERLAERDGRSASQEVAHLIQAEFQRVFGLNRDVSGGVAEAEATGTINEIRAEIRRRKRPQRNKG